MNPFLILIFLLFSALSHSIKANSCSKKQQDLVYLHTTQKNNYLRNNYKRITRLQMGLICQGQCLTWDRKHYFLSGYALKNWLPRSCNSASDNWKYMSFKNCKQASVYVKEQLQKKPLKILSESEVMSLFRFLLYNYFSINILVLI